MEDRARIAWLRNAALTMAGLLIGAGAFAFSYAEGASYLSDNPTACINCHIMRDQFASWQKSQHHSVATCNDCHVPDTFAWRYVIKAEQGLRHSYGFTFQNFHEPIQMKRTSARVVHQNCLRCHAELVNTIRAYHAPGAADVDCINCHAGVAHGPAP